MFDAPSLVGVPATDFAARKDEFHPALARMAEGSGGRYGALDIAASIEARDMQLWTVQRGSERLAVFVTEQVRYPRMLALRCVGCVGHDWWTWDSARHALEGAARAMGCDLIEASAPRKWRHVFPGYSEFHVLMEKVL